MGIINSIWQYVFHDDMLIISNSSQMKLQSCFRKFELDKLYHHAEGIKDNSFAGDVGNALHKAWQTFIISGDEEASIYELIRAYPISFDKGDFFNITAPRSLEACYSMLQCLMQQDSLIEYELAKIKCLDGETRDAVEVEFMIEIEGLEILGHKVVYVGFIDAIMFNTLSWVYRVFDLKTTRSTMKDSTAEYMHRVQCLPYHLVLEQMLQSMDPDKTLDCFDVTYIHAYIDLIEPSVFPYTFTKDRNELQEWYTKLTIDLNLLKKYTEAGWFPRRGNGCVFYNSPCQHLEICAERDHELIQEYFLMGREPAVPKVYNPWIKIKLAMEELNIHGN